MDEGLARRGGVVHPDGRVDVGLVVDEHALSPVDILQLQDRDPLSQNLALPDLPDEGNSF